MSNFRWFDFAACKNVHIDVFFPPLSKKTSKAQITEAFSYCDKCPVAPHCLQEAITTESVGIWGRTTQQQRTLYITYRTSDEEVTLEECDNLYQFLKTNDIYPYNKSYLTFANRSFQNTNN